ncbi:sulfotransferase family 2 domain-containing protein [Gilvibacter sediminis]|uniref:sulfotransferase family 2 domain-containing protein n=1 Tax=Gilvibacter sediminis TaxID=379071 RepID=UPI0023505921|nr:sulfotransferase family 2 domain-containing protein [Gilvibacter sediminis]MDC7999127.1 sulfotransferase family 2 domain-containing protein [Gilvibacter sediminis]
MLIPEHKGLFIHIPKTAGQSVEDYFLNTMGRDRTEDNSKYLLGINTNQEGPRRLAHLTAKEHVALGHIDSQDFESYFKFSFVRNPWERLVSLYRFRGFSSVCSFAVFVDRYLEYYLAHENWFFKPQVDFIYDENDHLLCDFVGRMENLQQDFDTILARLSLPQGMLPHHNKSKEKWLSVKTFKLYLKHPSLLYQGQRPPRVRDYRDHYSAKTLAQVHRLYERDIRLLNYQF